MKALWLDPQQICDRGFTWPFDDFPMEYLVTDETGKIELNRTIEQIRQGVEYENTMKREAKIFLDRWGCEMSLLDYTDSKESLHDRAEKVNRYERAIALLEKIQQAAERIL